MNKIFFCFSIATAVSSSLFSMNYNELPEPCKEIFKVTQSNIQYVYNDGINITPENIDEQPLKSRQFFLRRCLECTLITNNSNIFILKPLCKFIIKPHEFKDKELLEEVIIRDSHLLNYATFKHNALENSDIKLPLFNHIRGHLKYCVMIMTKNHKMNYGYSGGMAFRHNGKTFMGIGGKNAIVTDEAHTSYWKFALKPTIFLEDYQSGNENDIVWNVETLKNKTALFLLCLKHRNPHIKIPKMVVNHCIVPSIFDQPLGSIENHLVTVQGHIDNQIHAYNNLIDGLFKPIIDEWQKEWRDDFAPSAIQKFFDHFPEWYQKECDTLLKNKLNLIAQLIAYKK